MHSCSSMHTQRRKVGKEAKQIEQRRFCFLHSTQPVLPKKAGKCSTPVLSHWDGQDTAAVTLRHSAPRQPGPRAHLRSSAGSRRPARTDSPARRPEGTRRHGKDKAAPRTSGAPEPPPPCARPGKWLPAPGGGGAAHWRSQGTKCRNSKGKPREGGNHGTRRCPGRGSDSPGRQLLAKFR